MVNLLSTVCIVVATCAMMVAAAPLGSPVPAAAATAECSSLVYDLMDCMEFLVAGGSETTPDSSCCLGFKSLMEANEDCMCYALDTALSLGLEINMTRAVALPADCRVSSPPMSNCHVDTSPSGSPANSPLVSAPTFPPGGAPTVAPVSAPAASPGAPTVGPVRAPAAAPAPTRAPRVAPTSFVSAPSSEVAAPTPLEFPTESGAWVISATFSAFQLLVILILF